MVSVQLLLLILGDVISRFVSVAFQPRDIFLIRSRVSGQYVLDQDRPYTLRCLFTLQMVRSIIPLPSKYDPLQLWWRGSKPNTPRSFATLHLQRKKECTKRLRFTAAYNPSTFSFQARGYMFRA